MMLSDTANYFSQLTTGVVSVWFVCWALRKRYELDVKLTRSEQKVRWLVAASSLALTFVPGEHLAAIRIIGFAIGTWFIAWPNVAHSLVSRFLRSSAADE
jgi:hypothetical protein